MKSVWFYSLALSILLLAACKEKPAPVLPTPEFTGFETEVTADAAVITVTHEGDYGIVEAGVYLGADRRIQAGSMEPGRFTVSVTDLEPSTTYTYKAFLSSGLQEVTSPEQTFTTAAAPEIVAEGDGAYTVWTEDVLLEDILSKWDVNPADIAHLKIVGTLAVKDYLYIRTRMMALKSVDLRETDVTAFPDFAFYGTGLESVEFPEGLAEIGMCAFGNCSQLAGTLLFPRGLKSIGNTAFSQCGLLERVVFPDGLLSIGEGAFNYCRRLGGELVLPESLVEIGMDAFNGTAFHGDLVIPRNIKTIREGAFMSAGFDGRLLLPDGMTGIESVAFADNRFQGELNLPEGLLSIGDAAFGNNGFSGTLVLPASLEHLGERAFSGNSFSGDLAIPEKIQDLPGYVFADGINLQQYSRVILHKDVQIIRSGAFNEGEDVLKEVVCYREEPPVYEENAFNPYGVTHVALYVPAGSVERYRAAEGWKDFGSVNPIE